MGQWELRPGRDPAIAVATLQDLVEVAGVQEDAVHPDPSRSHSLDTRMQHLVYTLCGGRERR